MAYNQIICGVLCLETHEGGECWGAPNVMKNLIWSVVIYMHNFLPFDVLNIVLVALFW